MKEKEKINIVNLLGQRNVNKLCCRCNGNIFEVVNKTNIEVSQDKIIPACLVICSNCGYITMHSLGVLNI